MLSCSFCDEIARPERIKILYPEWPHENRIIYSNEGALVWPDIAPLILPQALIIPQTHFFSFLSSPRADRQAMMELLHSLWKSQGFGSNHDNPAWILVFEYGGGTCDVNGNRVSGCIDHCHLHVVPGTNLLAKTFKDDRSAIPCNLSLYSPEDSRPYLFMGAYDGERWIKGTIDFSIGENPPRRNYFRDLCVETMDFARGSDRHGSNWRRRMNKKWTLYCYEMLKSAI
ncbi:MAG: hypothetical protein AAB453_04510 [Patescibacteria group bacterium]